MDISRMRYRSTLCGWADLPLELLVSIFSALPSLKYVSRVCRQWQRAVLMLPRPVLLRPVVDSIPLDPLPFHPIDMELLVPIHVTPRNSVVLLTTEQRDSPSCYRYVTIPSPQLDPELRFIGGSLGVPLFIDDRQRCLEVRRLITLSKAQGSSLDATVLRIALPDGVESQDIYLGHMAVSTSCVGSSNWLSAGITSIMLVSRTEFFGIRAEHSLALSTTDPPPRWSRLQVTEPPEGESLEQGQRRTFVSILLAKDDIVAYYLLDASKRLALVTLSLFSDETIMELVELPMEIEDNELLEGNVRMTWLLHLPKWDHSGDDVVCLAYRQYDVRGYRYGRFEAFNLVEQMPRHWAERLSLGAGYCVFLGWGTGASAFGYRHPGRVGLVTNHIFDCQKAQHGLSAYHMGWDYGDCFQIVPPATSLAWPFPLWREPSFASYPCLEPLLVADDDLSESVNKENPLLVIQCADQDQRESVVTQEDRLPQVHGNSPNTDEDLREFANGDDPLLQAQADALVAGDIHRESVKGEDPLPQAHDDTPIADGEGKLKVSVNGDSYS